jgi:hypothetical protein
MSQSIRFLGLAVFTWAAVRAVSLGLIPGMDAFAFDAAASRPEPLLPPLQPTVLPPIEPLGENAQPPRFAMPYYPQAPNAPYGPYPAYLPYPVYVRIPVAGRSTPPQVIYVNPQTSEPPGIRGFDALAPISGQPQQLATALPPAAHQSTPSFEPPRQSKVDRLSLASWATMRNEAGPDGLANGGMLGGSQAGARLMWSFTPKLAANLRASAPVNSQRGAEAALGVRYQPLSRWPIAVNLERRHAFKEYGQSAFALFMEGGLYGRPLPWQSMLDGYFQAGIVDFNNPDWFADGQVAVTRPVWRNLSAGLGAWGGAQPGISRFDVGPRASLRIGTRMRAHIDYRLNVAGNAQPGSGVVVTLAGDF